MLFPVFLCVLGLAYAQNGIQVTINQGVIEGGNATDGNYYSFYGIHYGGTTAGVNRFKPPTPPPAYPGLYHAINNNVMCARPSSRGLVGIEDCLVLNIFSNNTTTPKPVLVWLVSEEYAITTPVSSFKHLVEQGIVIVELNYRLSMFGFLCLGVPEAPGNVGLRDVVQGLKWIQQNIAQFGGDPTNVALFGHGSGAAMVDLITMSPLAENLVHKAITQSGSALSPWAVAYNPVGMAQAVGAKLQYTNKNNQELAQLLIGTDVKLLAASLDGFEFLNNSILFAPCVENIELNPNNTFLADAPINLLRAGNYSHIPYIAGYVGMEGTIRAEEAAYGNWVERMQENFTNFLQVDLNITTNHTNVEKNIREYYFEQSAINVDDFLEYQGDTMILVSVIRGARERAATSRAPVRLYEFEYIGTMNSDWAITTISPTKGARHGSVLNFLLDNDLKPVIDEPVRAALAKRYVSFLNTGNPNQFISPGQEWEPITMSNNGTNYLFFSGGETSINSASFAEIPRVNPHQQRMTFWDDLYFKYYMPPQPASSGLKITCITLMLLISQFVIQLF